jgi:hypothetical protein
MCLIVYMFDIQLIFSCFVSTEYVPGSGGQNSGSSTQRSSDQRHAD